MELIFVTVPVFVVWVGVLVDLSVRGDLSTKLKVVWAIAVTLLWPTLIAYLLLRPVYGRLASADEVRGAPPGPRDELVGAVMDRTSGRTDAAQFRTIADRLKG